MGASSHQQSPGSGDPGDQKITVSLSPNEAREFAEKLAEDEEFRSELRKDPQGVLADWGIEWPQDCGHDIDLAPEEEIRSLIEAVDQGEPVTLQRGMGLGLLSLTFDCFCYFSSPTAGPTASREA